MFTDDGIDSSTYRPPLYPLLLAATDVLTHYPIAAMLVLQVILWTLTVALTWHIAKDCFGERAATLAGILLALAPMTARVSTVIMTETLFTFLVVEPYRDRRRVK